LALQIAAAPNTQALGQALNLNDVGQFCRSRNRAHVLLYINARHV
jgi:hypothetical protein